MSLNRTIDLISSSDDESVVEVPAIPPAGLTHHLIQAGEQRSLPHRQVRRGLGGVGVTFTLRPFRRSPRTRYQVRHLLWNGRYYTEGFIFGVRRGRRLRWGQPWTARRAAAYAAAMFLQLRHLYRPHMDIGQRDDVPSLPPSDSDTSDDEENYINISSDTDHDHDDDQTDPGPAGAPALLGGGGQTTSTV